MSGTNLEQVQTINQRLLGLIGEYYVAAELGRRNIYAQLTLENQKKVDLLIFSQTTDKILKIEVKSKQGDVWPNCKGINSDNSVIVFVDFKELKPTDRPTFYILNNEDWKKIVENIVENKKKKNAGKNLSLIDNTLVSNDEVVKSTGKSYAGCSIHISDIKDYEESWEKVSSQLIV